MTTNESLLKVVYGQNSLGPLDHVPLQQGEKMNTEATKRVSKIQELQRRVQAQIKNSNECYQSQANKHFKQTLFQLGDLVWVHLRKEQFPSKRKSNLMPRANGPFQVLEKVNDDAHKANLPGDYGVSCTFNVADLKCYFVNEHLKNLRSNSSLQREDDTPMGGTR